MHFGHFVLKCLYPNFKCIHTLSIEAVVFFRQDKKRSIQIFIRRRHFRAKTKATAHDVPFIQRVLFMNEYNTLEFNLYLLKQL